MRPIIMLAMALLAGAASCTGTVDIPDRVPPGAWGGDHIGMTVTDTGATIEYDCAMGTITEPLRLDANGAFDWGGVHYPGHGGPVRIDEPPNAHPARYTGHATATRMTIVVTPTDSLFPPQKYELVRGGNGRVYKCL